MTGFTICRLGPADVDELRRIDRACTIESEIAMRFDRGDDFFAWANLCFERHVYLGISAGGELVGFALVGLFTGQVLGEPTPCTYVGDVRVAPEWRGQGALGAMIRESTASVWPEAPLGLGVTKSGNRAGEGVASAFFRQSGVFAAPPVPLEVDVLPTFLRPRPPGGIDTRPARREDAPLVADLLWRHLAGRSFAPLPTADDVEALFARPGLEPASWVVAERRGRAVGVLGAWDLTPLRGTVVTRYSAAARLLRGLHRLARLAWRRMPPLPELGETLRVLVTTHVTADEPVVLRAMLVEALRRGHEAGHHAVTVGFVGHDPLAPAVRGLLRLPVRSRLHRFGRGRRPPTGDRPWFDLSFL